MHAVTSTATTITTKTAGRPAGGEVRHVLLLGTHGQANVGDELLLETFLHQFGRQHHYTVNSYEPAETSATLRDRYDVDVIDTATTRLALLKHIRDADVVVFGGGSVVKELYASVGRWRYATLVMVLAVVLAARSMRRPVLLCGVGVGPLPTRTGRMLAAAIIRSASLVSVRDHGSFTTCRELGLRDDRLVRIPDVVFVNGRERFVDTEQPALPAGGRLRIALNLNRDIANGDRWESFLRELSDALDIVAARTPIEIHALPMQSRFKSDDDLTVLRAFLADRPNWHPVVHEPADHRAVAEIIARCDVVVSERLHAIVIAAVLGRPAVGLVYDVKVAELVEQLGIADRSVDVNEPFDPERLARSIERTAESGPVEAARLAELANGLRAELGTHFDQVRRWLGAPGAGAWSVAAPRASR